MLCLYYLERRNLQKIILSMLKITKSKYLSNPKFSEFVQCSKRGFKANASVSSKTKLFSSLSLYKARCFMIQMFEKSGILDNFSFPLAFSKLLDIQFSVADFFVQTKLIGGGELKN